ncbi:MAG: RidA family protein [Gammaproteobacteria bacterium]|nr:RidA family protein [Gammaproteobacteria bacterium]
MQTLNPSILAAPFGRYSHAVAWPASQRLLRTSGQLALDAGGDVPTDVGDQAQMIFRHFDAILAEAGMQRRNVVHLSAFVLARQDMPAYMAARDAWLKDIEALPASTLLIVSGFTRTEFRVEIELMAAG